MDAKTETPFVLTCDAVARAALPLLIEGKLGGQINLGTECHYRYADGSPCVIGAAIPDALAKQLYGSVFDLTADGEIEVDENDLNRLERWQMLHDKGEFSKLRGQLETFLAGSAR